MTNAGAKNGTSQPTLQVPVANHAKYMTAPTFDFGKLLTTGRKTLSSVPLDRYNPRNMAS